MMRHGIVTRDSRVASHDLSQCPDPTRPDPLLVTAVSGVSGTTSIDLTVGVESPPKAEAWMLEALDWAPPCEYDLHAAWGSGPVAWAVWLRASPCRCHASDRFRLHCDGCFQHWTRLPLRCECGCLYEATDILVRAERI